MNTPIVRKNNNCKCITCIIQNTIESQCYVEIISIVLYTQRVILGIGRSSDLYRCQMMEVTLQREKTYIMKNPIEHTSSLNFLQHYGEDNISICKI